MPLTRAEADGLKAHRTNTLDQLMACLSVKADTNEVQRLTALKNALVADVNEPVPDEIRAMVRGR